MNKLIYFLSLISILLSCQQAGKESKEKPESKVKFSVQKKENSEQLKVEENKSIATPESKSKQINESILFLGYRNAHPIFWSWDINNLYQFTDTLQVFKSYSDTLKPIHIDDNMIIYSSDNSLLIETEIEDLTIQTDSNPIDAVATPNGRYVYFFTDYKKPIEILDLSTVESSKTDLLGWHLHIHEDFIYYAKGHPENTGYVKLFKSPLADLSQEIEILQGTFEEGMTFFPSDSLLGVHANLVTDIRPAIYNFKSKKYSFIDGIESEMNYPVLLPKTEKLGYYKISEFNIRLFEYDFDFQTADQLGIYE